MRQQSIRKETSKTVQTSISGLLAIMKLLLIFPIYLPSFHKEMTFKIYKMGPSSVRCK